MIANRIFLSTPALKHQQRLQWLYGHNHMNRTNELIVERIQCR